MVYRLSKNLILVDFESFEELLVILLQAILHHPQCLESADLNDKSNNCSHNKK